MRIAERWFERRSYDDGVTRLWEPHVHPLIRCNVWHVRGRDRDMVVDTGMGVVPIRRELQDLVDKPVVAVATHIHWDHVGGLHEFAERVMHRAEAKRMSPYDEFHTLAWSDFSPSDLALIGVSGYEAGSGGYLIDALPEPDYDPDAYRIVPVAPTREVDEGDGVDLGDRHFEVLHLPGHSPGSLGLWEEQTRTLFSGDAIYDGGLIDGLPDSDVADYVRTMKRLRDVPARVVHGGHEESFGPERLVELADAYLARRV